MKEQVNLTNEELIHPFLNALGKLIGTVPENDAENQITRLLNLPAKELTFHVIIREKEKKNGASASDQSASDRIKIGSTSKGLIITTKGGLSEPDKVSTGLGARSAVDILTNNELAETIADLKATIQKFDKEIDF